MFKCMAAGTLSLFLFASEPALAQTTLRVMGVRKNDVLNIREFPTNQSRIVGVIPPDGTGIATTGEREGNWVFVQYNGVEGWTYTAFLSREVRRGGPMSE
ncbi:SH3 domain-containing protein [Microvirga sp. 3-52]|uniref:SH3 domain-containing protein n=1 Tax=Microvirga sp. 3-52 TaxID=2792425 RepID=UPI001ACDEACE|nr:SH3 domain-containing protein [Microvirga sp. 3-52]MBO1906563.1 SH3 domain-containing protein [Microvirga sp. 3-52]MBS7453840.1 SH3 domain-containing protein [Microvirga sp. 3-52]